MDWRGRKYYQVRFSCEAERMRVGILKLITGVRIHPNNLNIKNMKDEYHERNSGYRYSNTAYRYVVSVPTMHSDILEFELRKAQRNDNYCHWREIIPLKSECNETNAHNIIRFKKEAKKMAIKNNISVELAKCYMVNFKETNLCENCENSLKCRYII